MVPKVMALDRRHRLNGGELANKFFFLPPTLTIPVPEHSLTAMDNCRILMDITLKIKDPHPR